ncbi:hypothetical protein BX600DRAFT_435685 [Xylariales sp. PMI_506]|nr:hypothetical protein BX600DRAFT_435685 [Xylariales sp. PMI_506]
MPVRTSQTANEGQSVKTYRSTTAAPKQQRFVHRRHEVTGHRRPQRSRHLLQETLTQMNFVSPTVPDEPVQLSSDEETDEPHHSVRTPIDENQCLRKARRKTFGYAENSTSHDSSCARDKKRRRTTGEAPRSSGCFQTQTLTQFLSNAELDQANWEVDGSEGDGESHEDGMLLVKETPKRLKSGLYVEETPPQILTTPSRPRREEIPSSQSPVTTPLLMRFSPANEHSPLQTKSASAKGRKCTRPLVVIQDSYSTLHSSPTTPTHRPKGAEAHIKTIRFDLYEDKENSTPCQMKPESSRPTPPSRPKRQALREVPDSDEEEDFDNENIDEVVDEECHSHAANSFLVSEGNAQHRIMHHPDHDGIEESAQLSDKGELGHHHVGTPSRDHPQDQDKAVDDCLLENIPTQAPDYDVDAQHSKDIVATTQVDSYAPDFYTQDMESQRVPLDTISATGPVSDKSDIIISIYGDTVKKMVDGTKTHEFRAWKMPETVCRVWVYITKPTSELRYMCIFGPPQVPGEIDEHGVGNMDFNQGKRASAQKYAYAIRQMYELNNPVSLKVMRDNGWPTAPPLFAFVPPAIVGQLTSNLRNSVWAYRNEPTVFSAELSDPVSEVSESQELANQIQSDIDHVTQLGSPDHKDFVSSPQSHSNLESSQSFCKASRVFARPAIPRALNSLNTTLPSAKPTLSRSHGRKTQDVVASSQATTVSQASSSSPTRTAPVDLAGIHDNSSPITSRRSLRSSQIPTRSQILPDSLLDGRIEEPPPIIWDSADDDSE